MLIHGQNLHVQLAAFTVLELESHHLRIKIGLLSIFWQRGNRILVNQESTERIGQVLK